MNTYDFYKKSADYILDKINYMPEIGLILGSALGSLSEEISDQTIIDYKDIPNFLISTVESHAGKLILGKLREKNVVCMSGRFHYYEGYEFEQLAIPIRVFKLLGVNTVILTNAAGAINKEFKPGDVMIIKDHIKLTGESPVRGKNIPELGPRFFDVSDMYTKSLRDLTKECANELNIDIKEGVYFYATGPQFETPAEIKAMRILGGDTVGMSTVTEAITAAHCSIKVLGLSLVTNMAAGVLEQPVTTEEVDETGEMASEKLKKLIGEIVEKIGNR
ncbi:purine-nucleoside phosphorylase [Tissierella sp. Yu-01]|uniref:purine-nucleoside phosphorylase n=1 Tax=Tissierella sp. Yu-01 TaxID=3035694 RepID=UPI00240E03F6|nr:purine-nucleoside phosphorylase [Tissierella sp. Yu-01]WFA08345.1 purine-nucleoside phosphorylase [Tissierella sp. Yu-01]